LLIGPDACGYLQSDFLLGVFMLGPRTFYRDHRHAAPELYLNLSDKSEWRLNAQDWQEYPAGSLIWNEAEAIHATRVNDMPFISVFIWLKNVKTPCITFPVDDWGEIETDLEKRT
jgi:quercetin dioxygenase-like cupin family protein